MQVLYEVPGVRGWTIIVTDNQLIVIYLSFFYESSSSFMSIINCFLFLLCFCFKDFNRSFLFIPILNYVFRKIIIFTSIQGYEAIVCLSSSIFTKSRLSQYSAFNIHIYRQNSTLLQKVTLSKLQNPSYGWTVI